MHSQVSPYADEGGNYATNFKRREARGCSSSEEGQQSASVRRVTPEDQQTRAEDKVMDLNPSGSVAKQWGGKRSGAGRKRSATSVRSIALYLNQGKRNPKWNKTKVWEVQSVTNKIHPVLRKLFSQVLPGRGQKKYRRKGGSMVPNTGLSKRMLLVLTRLSYTKQFQTAALSFFGGDVPDEIKPLFEADEETLVHLAVLYSGRTTPEPICPDLNITPGTATAK